MENNNNNMNLDIPPVQPTFSVYDIRQFHFPGVFFLLVLPCIRSTTVVPIREDLAAHSHWCSTLTYLYHTMPYHDNTVQDYEEPTRL